jgi:hypothetical protein
MHLLGELINSLTNFKAYAFFRQQGFGRTLIYLLLLSLAFGSIGFVGTWRAFNRDADDLTVWLKEKAPEFNLAKGIFTTSPETMVIYRKEGDLILVLGAKSDLNDSLTAGYARGIIVYSDRVAVTGSEGQRRELKFKDYGEMKVDKKEILDALDNRAFLGIFMFVFWMIFYFAGKLFSALFLTGLGLNYKAFLRFNISFGDVYKLSIRALSLGIILDALLNLSGIDFPYFFIIYYLMAASYLWLGMRSVRDDDMTAAGLKV